MTITLLRKTHSKSKNSLSKSLISFSIISSLLLSNMSWAAKYALDSDDIPSSRNSSRRIPLSQENHTIRSAYLLDDGNIEITTVSGKTVPTLFTPNEVRSVVGVDATKWNRFITSHAFRVNGNDVDGFTLTMQTKALGGGWGDNDNSRPILSGHSSYPGDSCGRYDPRTGAVLEPISITITPIHYDWSSTSPSYKDPPGSNGYNGGSYGGNGSGGSGNTSSFGDTAKHGAIGELAEYHIKNSGGFKQFEKLHPAVKEEVMLKANYLWTHASPFVCPPSTKHLNNALVEVVYMPPQWQVFGWAKDHPSLKYLKNVSEEQAPRVVEEAGHHALRHNEEYKNITSLLAGYDNVMSDGLRHTFNYHRDITKAEQYQDIDQCFEGTLINHALSLMKEHPDQFTGPDTSPITASVQYHETMGHALLKAFGNAIDTIWCETMGGCKVNASYVKLGQELIKNGPKIIDLTSKGGRWIATSVGLAASTMWHDKVKHWITAVVDFIKPIVLTTPIEQLAIKVAILDTWGEVEGKRIVLDPKALQAESDLIKAVYPKGLLNKADDFGPDDEYEQADYHHQNSNGDKSKPPKDPKNNLPGSVKVKQNNDRIRVNADPKNEEYIVYSKHSPKKWHAHVRPWMDMEVKQGVHTRKIQGLTQAMRNALEKAGKVKHNGDFIK